METIDTSGNVYTSLEKKLSMFHQYLSITKQLKQAIENEKELRKLLSARQHCIKKIQNIDASIGDSPYAMTNYSSPPFKKNNGSVDRCLNNIRTLIEEIIPLDKELITLVKAESDGLKTELLKMRHAQKATRNYVKKGSSSPRLLNKKS